MAHFVHCRLALSDTQVEVSTRIINQASTFEVYRSAHLVILAKVGTIRRFWAIFIGMQLVRSVRPIRYYVDNRVSTPYPKASLMPEK